jgi:uncharacterized membrane protein
MGAWVRANPVWFMSSLEAVVVAVMNLVLVFGVHLTADQIAAINGVVVVVLVMVMGLWAQTPLSKLIDAAESRGYTKGLTAKHD